MNQMNSPGYFPGQHHPQQGQPQPQMQGQPMQPQQNLSSQMQQQQPPGTVPKIQQLPPQVMQQMQPAQPPGMIPQAQANPNLVANLASTNPNIMPSQQVSFQANSEMDNLTDPIVKCKELYNQLTASLQLLLNQLSIVLNPSTDQSRVQTENQFQMLGKFVENFNRVCDLLIVNLRTAHEAQSISFDLRTMSRYYTNAGTDNSTVNMQMTRIAEFKNSIQKFISNNTQNTNALK